MRYPYKLSTSIINKIIIPLIVIINFAAFSSPKYSGSLDTTVYTYSSEKEDLSGTEPSTKVYEKILLNINFSDDIVFHTNNRIAYRTSKNEDPEQWDFNLFYGFLDYTITDDFNIKIGRIMDINSLVYSFYDGSNIEYKFNFSKHKFTVDIYGGLTVNDDYLEDENETYGFNSFDYRNLYIEQRYGDYIGGAKANYLANGIGILNIDYQVIYNDNSLAEQYLSLDFDTLFSKKIILYGYGTFDLVDKTAANSLAAGQINPIDFLSVLIEHEYYRPVYIKDSFFWSYFEPYGNQELSGTLIFYISKLMTFDIKYGKIFYDSSDDCGDEVTGNFEHRGLYQFGIRLNGDYITGPEGDKITGQVILKRRFFNIDAIGGGGAVVYDEDKVVLSASTDDLSKGILVHTRSPIGYFATLGAEMEIFDDIILTADGEYYNNRKYSYDLRGIFSLKYIF